MKKGFYYLLVSVLALSLLIGSLILSSSESPIPKSQEPSESALNTPISDPKRGQLQVGASMQNINPTQSHLDEGVYLAGYGVGPVRKAEGIRDDIWARAMAVSDGKETFVLVSLDLIGIGNVDLQYIRERASFSSNVPEGNILVSATHTHSGPDFQGLWGGVPASYRKYVRTQTISAIVGAVKDLKPARIYITSFELPEYNKNRAGKFDFTDATMTVLNAITLAGGLPIVTLVNYAAHPTILGSGNKLVSSDFPSALRNKVEEKIGGMAMYINGAVGDVSARRQGLNADQYGAKLGEIAVAHLQEEKTRLKSKITSLKHKDFELPVKNKAFLVAYAGSLLRPYSRLNFDPQIGYYVVTRVHYIEYGPDLALMSVPGEAYTRFALPLRQMSNSKHVLFLGLTSDTLGYFVPEDEWDSGEPFESLDEAIPEKLREKLKDIPPLSYVDPMAGIPFVTMGYGESVSVGRHACGIISEKLISIIP
jgi:hypothetical protein